MSIDKIIIRGAREHNLKNIDLELPKNKLIVFTGISGSGKSSLAFDTLYAEGQRRYVESLSSYARQFLGMMKKPQVETIEGLSPAISIDQKAVSVNPRSTIGTITEIYDYLRLLFARVGHPHCPRCGREITKASLDQIVKGVIELIDQKTKEKATKQLRFMILSPIIRGRKGEFRQLFESLSQKGFSKVRIDRQIFSLDEDFVLIKTNKHDIDVVIDRLVFSSKELSKFSILPSIEKNARKFHEETSRGLVSRLTASIEQALKLSAGLVIVAQVLDASFTFPAKPTKFEDHLFSEKFACPICNISLPEIEPRTFSFNSPYGACPACSGLGSILKIDSELMINPNLTIAEGGILPFSHLVEDDTWFSRTVKEVANQYKINFRLPIKQLPREKLKILLYGAGEKFFTVWGTNRFGRETTIETQFEGFIPALERRYQETESDFIRAEIEKFMRRNTCPVCNGARLRKEALAVTLGKKSINEVTQLSIKQALAWTQKLPNKLSLKEKTIGQTILKEIVARLQFLVSVGLDYLTLDRSAGTLASGESQRIRLASQIGSGLAGVLYILDEPSIGLHQKDNKRLIETLKALRDLGNTVIVVEHDREMMENADWIIDFGPLAGDAGGRIVAQGTPAQVQKAKTLTGKFLALSQKIKFDHKEKKFNNEFLKISGCRQYNLKGIDVKIPLGNLICVTGVSGSGKSTLVDNTLYHALAFQLHRFHPQRPGKFERLEGWEFLKNVVLVDQSPIGRTPRSNPATYVGAFTHVREVFAKTRAARMRGYREGRFSFNVKGGRCEACRGEGQIKIEMQFLPPVWIDCEVCKGARYNKETLQVTFKDKNISQVLDLVVDEALKFFANIPCLQRKLQTLADVGLGYIKLGQPAPTLSGGEAQRVKLAKELSKTGGQTLYILDEPTTGLHYEDLTKLLKVLKRLVEKGNTVLVIEHNLDVILAADWIIDLGPEGGDEGGKIVACGTPVAVAGVKSSYTGQFLAQMLK